MGKLYAYLSTLTYLLMLGINAAANILPINNVTTGQVSNSLKMLFVPAPWVFSIWGFIYLLLGGFLLYMFTTPQDSETTQPVAIGFIISCMLNSAWIFAWHYRRFNWSLIIMAALLLTLIMVYIYLHNQDFIMPNFKEKYLLLLPFSVYPAWVAIATLAHLNINFELWLGSGYEMATAIISLGVAVVVASLVIAARRDQVWGLVLIWALAGIAWEQRVNIISWAALAGIVVTAAVMIQVNLNSRRSFF